VAHGPRNARETLEEILEELDMIMHAEMVGKSASDHSPCQHVCQGSKLIQQGLAIPTEEGMSDSLGRAKKESSLQPIAEGTDKPVPTVWLSPLPSATWTENIFICPLIPSQDIIRIVDNMLDSKYQGFVHRQENMYWLGVMD
jgi:hypothetical protein